tara:strand:+ start:1144 stop:1545 length:402 start_codon:yes stop_codon:yes gene_type:complete
MNAFQMIDSNRIATPKQTYGVACHFANIHASSPSERYGLTKVFNAVINKFYGDQDSHMTHGEVTDFREHQVVPVQFLELIRKPKAAKKVTPINSVAKQMDDRITAVETEVSKVGSKLDAILAILARDVDGFSL